MPPIATDAAVAYPSVMCTAGRTALASARGEWEATGVNWQQLPPTLPRLGPEIHSCKSDEF